MNEADPQRVVPNKPVPLGCSPDRSSRRDVLRLARRFNAGVMTGERQVPKGRLNLNAGPVTHDPIPCCAPPQDDREVASKDPASAVPSGRGPFPSIPALKGWAILRSPSGRNRRAHLSSRRRQLNKMSRLQPPALKRRAILVCPSGTKTRCRIQQALSL